MMKKLIIFFVLLLSLGEAWGQGVKPELKVQVGHQSNVNDIVLLPNEQTFLSISDDWEIIHWDIHTKKTIRVFSGHQDEITHIFLFPDGKSFITESEDFTLIHWDIASGRILKVFKEHTKGIYKTIMLPDYKSFITAGKDGKIIHWDIASGNIIKITQQEVDDILLLPDNKTFLALTEHEYDEKYTLSTWDINTLEKTNTEQDYQGYLFGKTEVILLPDKTTLLAMSAEPYKEDYIITHIDIKSNTAIQNFKRDIEADKDSRGVLYKEISLLDNGKTFMVSSHNTVLHWDIKSGRVIQKFKVKTFPYRDAIDDILISPNEENLFVLTDEDNIIQWNIKTGKLIKTFEDDIGGLEAILTVNQESLFSISKSNINEWNLKTGEKRDYITKEFEYRRGKITPFSDKKSFLISADKVIIYWNDKKHKVSSFTGAGRLDNIIFTPHEISFLSIGEVVKSWNISNGIKVSIIKEGVFNKDFVFLSPDKKTCLTVYSNSDNSTIRHWDIQTNKKLNFFQAGKKQVRDVFFLGDGESFITIPYVFEESVPITHWNLKTGQIINTFTVPESYAGYTEAFLVPNNHMLLILGNENNTVAQWDIKTGKLVKEFSHKTIKTMKLLNNNVLWTSGFFDGNSFVNNNVLWDLRSGKKIKVFEEDKSIDEIVMSPNGGTCLLNINDAEQNIIQHFDIINDKVLKTFRGHERVINNLVLLPDGKHFLSTSLDSSIKYWSIYDENALKTFSGHSSYINSIFLMTNHKTFLSLGQDRTVKHWDISSGKLLSSFNHHASQVRYLEDLGLLMTQGKDDNTIKFWSLERQTEIATIIPKKGNNQDYVVFTPDNYYFATKGGVNDLVHYVRENQVFLFSQFDLQYNRPDIVLKRLGLASDSLIKVYQLAYTKRLKSLDFSQKRVDLFLKGDFDKDFDAPEIELIGKEDIVSEDVDTPEYTFSFTATDAKYNIERVFVNVDGVPLYGAKGDILKNPSQNLAKREVKVPLIAGKNIITLSVINAQGVASLEKRLEITYNPPQPTKPTLYVFSIGVNEYQDEDITKLDYAVKDAEKVVELFAQNKGSFAAVKKFTLTDAEVNKESVLKLRQELLKTNPEDMVIFTFAGHGFLDDSRNYYLATYDTDLENLPTTGLRYSEVERLLDSIPARKKMMLIDACHSGEIDKEGVSGKFKEEKRPKGRVKRSDGSTYEVNVLSQTAFDMMKVSFSDLRIGTGTTVIAASGGLESATEDYEWGHGAFTYALIKALERGEADLNLDGQIFISELQRYLIDEVQELTNDLQRPTSRMQNIQNDFRLWQQEEQTESTHGANSSSFEIRDRYSYKKVSDLLERPDEVTRLRLGNHEYSLEDFPKELLRFKNLEILDLSYHNITTLPDEIKELRNLNELDLSHNRLNSFPQSITTLHQLKTLNISNNSIKNLPPEIKSMAHLEILDLSSLDLDSLPREIGALKNLKELNIRYNYLETLPKEFGELKNLKKLYMTCPLVSVIGELEGLEVLEISGRQLDSIPDEIRNLKSLKKLNVITTSTNIIENNTKAKLRKLLPNCKIVYKKLY